MRFCVARSPPLCSSKNKLEQLLTSTVTQHWHFPCARLHQSLNSSCIISTLLVDCVSLAFNLLCLHGFFYSLSHILSTFWHLTPFFVACTDLVAKSSRRSAKNGKRARRKRKLQGRLRRIDNASPWAARLLTEIPLIAPRHRQVRFIRLGPGLNYHLLRIRAQAKLVGSMETVPNKCTNNQATARSIRHTLIRHTIKAARFTSNINSEAYRDPPPRNVC